jgi:hypothetical protein
MPLTGVSWNVEINLVCRHLLFANIVKQSCSVPAVKPTHEPGIQMRPPSRPADLPVYGAAHYCV